MAATLAELQADLAGVQEAIALLQANATQEFWVGGADRWRGVNYSDLVAERRRLRDEIDNLTGSSVTVGKVRVV